MSDADSLAKIIESSAPLVSTIFGAVGVGLGGLLKFLTDRENRKIRNAKLKLAKFDKIEDQLRHQSDALKAIASECRIASSFRNTFGVESISPAQVNLLLKAISRIRIYCVDVLEDGKFSSYLEEDEEQ